MRKLINTFLIIIFVSAALLIVTNRLNAEEGFSGDNTLTVYNWGDYIDPELITKFEEETGIKIIYQTFDSNEAMMTKIEQGGVTFDVCVPSEYTIAKMKKENLLIPVDKEKLPNLKNIDQRFMNLSFDPNNEFSIPYFWGTVGIIYNPSLTGVEITSWEDLWDPKLEDQILLVDGAREEIGMSLNSLGYSLNDIDKTHLIEAKEKLDLLVPNVKAIVGDEIKMLMAGNEAGVAVVWSGDASEIMDENEEMDYVVPSEGSNLWFDNMVIPTCAKNVDGAHQFINFMLDPENAATNADYVGYATPNVAALELMDEEVTGDERFYPAEELTNKLEVYEDLGKRNLAYYNELFLEFKMHTN